MKFNYTLSSKDHLTSLLNQHNIDNWQSVLAHVKALPYGRHTNRNDFSLVLTEQKGTCSSKHAFLKHVADLNNIPNVQLILGMYKMGPINTPKIVSVLSKHNLHYIPEAHCYLKIDGERFDFTSIDADFNTIKNDVLLEKIIQPQDVITFKVNFHKAYIKDWIKDQNIPLSFEDVWNIREQCIIKLSH